MKEELKFWLGFFLSVLWWPIYVVAIVLSLTGAALYQLAEFIHGDRL